MSLNNIFPFTLHVGEQVLEDLQNRLDHARWPSQINDQAWARGTDRNHLESLVKYWRNDYEWRRKEEELNQYPHYKCEIDGIEVHFVYVKGKGSNAMPLILTHGWPDSFLRYWKVIPMLTDPSNYGGDADDSFDIIIPSIPGFGFSSLPETGGMNASRVADLWVKMMTEKLGYQTFAAGGGDVGTEVTKYLAFRYPEHLIGIYINDLGNMNELLAMDDQELTAEEKKLKEDAQKWMEKEGGYMSIQSHKPQTVAYGLTDSPLGLAAWLTEKFVSWSDSSMSHQNQLSKEDLLTNIMIYYTTGSIGSSFEMYYENAHSLPPIGTIQVPAGVSLYPADSLSPPRAWAERKLLNILHWKVMSRGGHFTAMEEPVLYAEDIRDFFRKLR